MIKTFRKLKNLKPINHGTSFKKRKEKRFSHF